MIERNAKGQFEKGSHWREPKAYYDKSVLFDMYVTRKQSCAEIAKEFGVTPSAIRFWLMKHDIRRRNTSQARKAKRWGSSGDTNPMYGRYGDRNPHYKGGISPERQAEYSRSAWKNLEADVLARANGYCERCGEKAERLHIHHIKPIKDGGEIVCESKMLIVLCPKCHGYIHSKRNIMHEYLQ